MYIHMHTCTPTHDMFEMFKHIHTHLDIHTHMTEKGSTLLHGTRDIMESMYYTYIHNMESVFVHLYT